MTEEAAKFKHEKQLPAEEQQRGSKPKGSSKKPWRLVGEWIPEKVFTRSVSIYENDKRVVTKQESYTVKELMERRERGDSGSDLMWYFALWGPPPFGTCKYKTKKDAMNAWETALKKREIKDDAIYHIVNDDTGESIRMNKNEQ